MEFSRSGLKIGMQNGLVWSEIRSGYREPGAHPDQTSQGVPLGYVSDWSLITASLKHLSL